MEREVFKSNLLRGIPMGGVRGFIFGFLIMMIALILGMDDEMVILLLGAAVILGCIIGTLGSIGKMIEADANGIYLKNKEYLFAESDMYMQVHTHYYHCIPVTERWIDIVSKDGKHKVKCSFLGGQDAGRLAKIIEDGMREKYRSIYNDVEPDDASVQTFVIPAAELAEKMDKNSRIGIKVMFWFLAVLFSWGLISMIIQDQLEDYGLIFLLSMALFVLILGSVNLFLRRKFKRSARKIPYEIVFSGGIMYIDGKPFTGMDVTKVVMTPERGDARGDMRKLVFYERNERTSEFSFGFRADRKGFPEYGLLVETVKDHFGDKFAYDFQ